MQPNERDTSYLWDMRTYATRVASFVEGKTFDDFGPDSALRLATERGVEVVGEAARRISQEFQMGHPEIKWRDIIGQRNILAHEYGSINPQRLWSTATEDMRPLIEAISQLLPPEP